MILYFKYDIAVVGKKVLEEQLEKLQLPYSMLGYGEVEINDPKVKTKLNVLQESLNAYGIEILESPKNILVQKAKDAIVEMVYTEENLPAAKISAYLADKLNCGYGYIFNLFSEVTFTSIENYIIIQKIERAKQLLATGELNITEIAYKLNYSSIAHFSNQFKNTIGLSPSAFQRIMRKRKILYMKGGDNAEC